MLLIRGGKYLCTLLYVGAYLIEKSDDKRSDKSEAKLEHVLVFTHIWQLSVCSEAIDQLSHTISSNRTSAAIKQLLHQAET